MTKGDVEDEQITASRMANTPWKTWGRADDVAKAALFLASDNAAWVTGVALPVGGGFMARLRSNL